MTDFVPAKDIYEAINRVMSQVGYIQKTKSAGLKYPYANESTIIAEIRPAMVSEGIIMFCSNIYGVETREYQTAVKEYNGQVSGGTSMVNVSAYYQWTFFHYPSGSFTQVMSRGEGSDSSDKANNKAATASKKYALLQTFLLATGDDPDQFQDDERAGKTVSRQSMTAAATALPGAVEKAEPIEDATKWPEAYFEVVIAEKLFENVFEVNNTIKHSMILDPQKTPIKNFQYWCRQYRKYREENNDVIASAGLADDEYRAQLARIKQDAATGA
jgi:hypothetical protein